MSRCKYCSTGIAPWNKDLGYVPLDEHIKRDNGQWEKTGYTFSLLCTCEEGSRQAISRPEMRRWNGRSEQTVSSHKMFTLNDTLKDRLK